jgi:methionine-rich copper-binding protein CopC
MLPGAALAGLLLLLLRPGIVAAHAALVTSTPAVGEVSPTVPPEAVLTFSEALQPGSTFDLLDDTGATVATGAPDPANDTVMRVALPPLKPGVYEVRWTSVAADGDIERDTFSFTVAAANPPLPLPTLTPASTEAATAVPTAAPAPTGEPTGGLMATPAPSEGGGSATGGGTDVLLPILAVVVLVGGGLALMLRRRGPA